MSKKLALILLLFCCSYYPYGYADQLKIGVMQHDLVHSFEQKHERGQNIILEYIASEEYKFLKGLPHIGTSINNCGYTSILYTGLTWNLKIKESFFLEITFGGSINNGGRKIQKKKQAVGSKLLFRESLSIGYNFNNFHNISLMVDHVSNARLVQPNPGLTDFGIRYGYVF